MGLMNFKDFSSGSLSRVQLLSVPLVLTVVLLGGTGWYTWESYRTLQRIHSRDMRLIQLSGKIDYLDEALTMSARMAAATGDPQWIQRYKKFDPQVFAAIEEASKLLPSVFSGKTFEQLNDVATQLQQLEKRSFELLQQGKTQQARKLLFSPEYERQKQRYSEVMGEIITEMEAFADRSLERQTQKAWTVLVAITITLILLVILWTIILRMLILSIQAVRQASNAVSDVSGQITETVDEQEQLAIDRAGAVNQISTTMKELEQSARQAAERIEAALKQATQALDLANQGTQTVDGTLTAMEQVRGVGKAIQTQTNRLTDRTKQISTISKLVGELANQTNLLALNASVEAVRAGEAGKGFSVVAAEIRKLADRSQGSAQRIAELVANIQSAVSSTEAVTSEGLQMVTRGMNFTQETENTFSQFVEAVNNITNNSHQIYLMAQQQADATQQLAVAMESLNEGTQRTTKAISQTQMATNRLNDTAKKLNKLV